MRIPTYRRRQDGRASVRIHGRDVYLGRIDSPESHALYQSLVSQLRDGSPSPQLPADRKPKPMTVAEVAERWLLAKVNEGTEAKHLSNIRTVARELALDHGLVWIADFGPRSLKQILERLRTSGRNRQGINRTLRHARECFKWAASEELISGAQLTELRTVPALRFGKAPERPRRQPADPTAVQSILEHLERQGNHGAAGILRVLRATGMRPGEACSMTWGDLSPAAGALLFRPASHKNAHRGIDRVIALVGDALNAVEDQRRLRVPDPSLPVFVNTNGDPWQPIALQLAFRRAVKATGCPLTSPYQLRHLAGTQLLNATGDGDLTRALLGHATSRMTDHYTRHRDQLAVRAAQALARVQGGAA
jgi:integrase